MTVGNLIYAYNGEPSSGALADASGNGRDTALTGSLVRGAPGSGYTYSGAAPNKRYFGQSTTAADSAGPALTGLQTAHCTMCCWIVRTDNSVGGWIGEIKSGGSGNRGILLLSGNASFRCRNSSNTAATPGAAHPPINVPFFFAGTWDGTTVRTWVNGVQTASAALSGAPHTGGASSSLFDTIGSETKVTDLRYYDEAMTGAELIALMAVPLEAPTPGFVGWGVPL